MEGEGFEGMLAVTALSLVFFWLLFEVVAKKAEEVGKSRNEALQIGSRAVALTHSLVVGLIASYDVLVERAYQQAEQQRGAGSFLEVRTAGTWWAFPICCAYLLYDNYPQLWYKQQIGGSWEMVLHHWIGIPGLLYNMYTGVCGYYASVMLCFELSTPFLHGLYFLPLLGVPRSSRLFFACGLAFLLSFFCFRVLGSLYVLYGVLAHADLLAAHALPTWFTALASTSAFTLLNFYWFHRVIQEATKMKKNPNTIQVGGN